MNQDSDNKICQVLVAMCTYYVGTFLLIYYLEKKHYFSSNYGNPTI